MSDKLLSFLRGKEGFFSGEELSRRLGVSRTAVWKDIHELKEMGYKIEAQPHEGYRLVSAPDKLFADEIQHGLKTQFIGKRIFSYEELDSTNDAAWKLGEQGLAEGACVFAEHQKKGKGRLGRSWNSPKGQGILLSVLLRPEQPPAAIPRLTLAAALAVVDAFKRVCGIEAEIKWPNDVVYEGKKLCGILTEMSAEADRVRFVVLGIGINVNAKSADLPPGATSLREIKGEKLSRVLLAQAVLAEIEKKYQRLKKGEFESLAEEWETHSLLTGHRVQVALLDRTLQGQATGIDAEGALWIRTDNGLQERILSGDVKKVSA